MVLDTVLGGYPCDPRVPAFEDEACDVSREHMRMDDVWTPLRHNPQNVFGHGRTGKLPKKPTRASNARHRDVRFRFVTLHCDLQDHVPIAALYYTRAQK